MDANALGARRPWIRNEEEVYSLLGSGIVIGLIFWPLLDSILTIALVVYWLIVSRKDFSSPQARMALVFCLLYGLVLTGTFYSANTKEAFFKLQQKSAFLVFPLVFGTSAALTPRVFRRVFAAFMLATVLGCLYCLGHGLYVWLARGDTGQLYGYDMVVVKDMSPFVLGLCCLLCIMYVFTRVYTRSRKSGSVTYKRYEAGIAALLFLFLLLLGNRNILFYMTGVLIFYAFRLLPRMVHRLVLLGSFALAVAIAVVLNPSFRRQWHDLVDFSQENTIQLDQDASLGRGWGGKTLRLTIWKCGLDVLEKHWPAGVGTGDVQDTLQLAYEKRKFYFASRYNTYNAHNQYLQETLASGIPGILIFLSCIILPLSVAIRERNRLYILFILCFAFVCITESILEVHKGVIWYSFFNAFLFFRKAKASII